MQGNSGGLIVFFVLVVMAAVGIPALIFGLRAEEKRREELETLARQAEWQLEWEPDRTLQDRYSGKPFLSLGRGRVRVLVTGRHRERDFLAFQFSYATSNGQTSSAHFFTHAAVALPGPAPRVEIKQRGPGRAIAEAFGSQAFRLGEPQFDDCFTVLTDNEAFARALLQGGLAAWLTGMAFPNSLVIDGSELRSWTLGKLRADELPHLLDYLCDVMERIPAQVWPVPHD